MGFNYGSSNDQPQATRYPPWENNYYRTPEHISRPLTAVQSIPENFHEYHFRSVYGASSRSGFPRAITRGSETSFGYADFGSADGSTPSRNWEHTGLGSLLTKGNNPTIVQGGVRFTIMSYNILAPGLLAKHPELYKRCNPRDLNWEFRLRLIFEEFAEYSPDIVCLQEVEADQYERSFKPWFNANGFRGEYKKKTGDKEDGCAIFYRTSKFLLVEKLGVEFLQPHVPLLNRDNIGLLLKLETRNVVRRQKVVVGTTHLLFNQKRHDVRLAQAQLLLAELDRLAFCGYDKDGNTLYHPILMTGDFNCKPYNSVTKLFSEGRLQYLDENGDLIKLLRRKGINSLMPRRTGILDSCQHYKVLLERYKRWRQHKVNADFDLRSQESLVNVFPYLETQGFHEHANRSDTSIQSPPEELISLLSPATEETASIMETDGSSNKLLAQAAQKVALQEQFSGANYDSSESSSKEQLYFPLEQTRFANVEQKVLDELSNYGIPCDFGSGVLSHGFNFRDIYSGRLDREGKGYENVVTTKQNGWTCVDYIFQSMTWNPTFNKMVEGKLKLIRRLGLFTRADCKKKDIPSDQHPSDHFPLVAEFLLRH